MNLSTQNPLPQGFHFGPPHYVPDSRAFPQVQPAVQMHSIQQSRSERAIPLTGLGLSSGQNFQFGASQPPIIIHSRGRSNTLRPESILSQHISQI